MDQSMIELISTGFIAGFTIVFGIAALGVVQGATESLIGEASKLAGALAFALGLVFLVVGRAELFSENFFDPAATLVETREGASKILRLWTVTFGLNLVGGSLFCLAIVVPGVLPDNAARTLTRAAEEIVGKGSWSIFASAIVGGALVALLSFMLAAVSSSTGRIILAYLVGFLLAAGAFAHVIVTALHVIVGMLLGAPIETGALFRVLAVATVGNLVGGIGLVTFSHIAQAKGGQEGN